VKYIADKTVLVRVLGILQLHETEVREYFLADLRPRVMLFAQPQERARTLFLITNADRQGATAATIKEATAVYWQRGRGEYERVRHMAPEQAHSQFLAFLCTTISHMEQKTANLFLKWVWIFNDALMLDMAEVVSWGPYLHVPLDRWILRMLGRRTLRIGTDSYESDFWTSRMNKKTGKLDEGYEIPVLGQERYALLQQELKESAVESGHLAITLDSLWYVGSKCCSYTPSLCGVFWLREMCMNGGVGPDWNTEQIPTKQEMKDTKRLSRERIKAAIKAMEFTYRRDYPDASQDFYAFSKTEVGKDWCRSWFATEEPKFFRARDEWLAAHLDTTGKGFLEYLITSGGQVWLNMVLSHHD